MYAIRSYYAYMQEMIRRFSQEFAVDLRNLFLPAAGSARRSELLQQATVKSFETKTETFRTESVSLA